MNAETEQPPERVCTRCRESLPEDMFGWKKTRTQRRPRCKVCDAQYMAEYRARKLEQEGKAPEPDPVQGLQGFPLLPTWPQAFLPHQHGLRWSGMPEGHRA